MQSAQHHGGLPAALPPPLPPPCGLSQTDYYRITFTLGPCGCEEGGRVGAEPLAIGFGVDLIRGLLLAI